MERLIGRSRSAPGHSNEHWISMSDLMSGLMLVFLLIAIAYMRYVQVEKDKIKEVAVAYQNAQVALYKALEEEFDKDLPRWDAEIDKSNLEFRFKSPEVLFDKGRYNLKPSFQNILDDFFPRYLQVLGNFREHIAEVRIEGHTSSDWDGAESLDEAYFNNMVLSQGRTREVLQYLFLMPSVHHEREWLKKTFAAVGFSSAHPVLDENGSESSEKSRRVTFKVFTNAERQILKIIQDAQ